MLSRLQFNYCPAPLEVGALGLGDRELVADAQAMDSHHDEDIHLMMRAPWEGLSGPLAVPSWKEKKLW